MTHAPQDPAVLYLDADLPPAVLVDRAAPALAALMAGVGGIWCDARHSDLERDADGVVRVWHPRQGTTPAMPAAPNKGHSRLGPQGLLLNTGVNCGFALEGAVPDAACLSFAVLYHSGGADIRTLLSVNLHAAKNYLFLYEQEGTLGLKDQANNGTLERPAAGAGIKLVTGGLSDRRLFLRQNTGPVQSVAVPGLEMAGTADLFIGCRSHRDGLLKTLGQGAIAAVFLWPGLNVLDAGSATAVAQLRALDAWRFWDA